MKNYYVFNFESVDVESDHPCTLKFEGYIPVFGGDRLYTFEFTGTDLTTTASVKDSILKKLKKELHEDYGSAPYELSKAQDQLEQKFQYRISY